MTLEGAILGGWGAELWTSNESILLDEAWDLYEENWSRYGSLEKEKEGLEGGQQGGGQGGLLSLLDMNHDGGNEGVIEETTVPWEAIAEYVNRRIVRESESMKQGRESKSMKQGWACQRRHEMLLEESASRRRMPQVLKS